MGNEKLQADSRGVTVTNPNGRIIILGDLHGMHDEAVKLLEKCQTHANDVVIMLGDLVDRGPDSSGCVDLAMRREKIQNAPACILGNHEEKMLFYQDIERQKGSVQVNVPNHVSTRAQLRSEHYDYFRQLPKFIRLPEHNAVCVHAGVWPGRPIEEQTDRHLLHVQMINPFDKWGNPNRGKDAEKSLWASKVPEDEKDNWKFWTHFWDGPERIIFGHSVLNKPLVTDKVVGLDGGGCFGLELWAFILPDNIVVRQRCVAQHDMKDLDRRGNRNKQLFLIHDDVGTY